MSQTRDITHDELITRVTKEHAKTQLAISTDDRIRTLKKHGRHEEVEEDDDFITDILIDIRDRLIKLEDIINGCSGISISNGSNGRSGQSIAETGSTGEQEPKSCSNGYEDGRGGFMGRETS